MQSLYNAKPSTKAWPYSFAHEGLEKKILADLSVIYHNGFIRLNQLDRIKRKNN